MTNLSCIRSTLHYHRWALAILVLLPILANAFAFPGAFNNDPTLQFIGLGSGFRPGLIPGQMDWLDPTVGYITQPVGHLVASDWLHGIVPWWNPYSGVGMPLAAEMESSVFFMPFVFLLHWSWGWLLLRMLLQILCGLFAYAFFAKIKLRREAAFLGGALYALSPIFFLSPHAAIYPLPFLPLLLLGLEYTAQATLARRNLGWSLVTIALAYSILGGFPEIAYLDGLLAAVWTLWLFSTLPPRLWLRFAGKLSLALVIALCICAPLLIPFFEYLPHANVGPHAGTLFTHNRLEATLMPVQIFPFLYGPLNAQPPASLVAAFGGGFVRMPSWVSISVVALAIAALWRRGPRPQPRYVLLFWIVLWEARYIGFAPVIWLLNLVPGLATSDIIRFSGPMLAFSVFTLAAFGLDDYLEYGAMSLQRLYGVAGTLIVIVLAAIAPVSQILFSWWAQKPFDANIGCLALMLALVITLFLFTELLYPRHKYALLALLLAEPFCGLAYTQFAGFRGGKINLAPVHFLQANIGLQRMASLGPLDLNFPLRYGIASVDYASMPTPMDWTDYITTNLFSHYFTQNMLVTADLSIYKGAAPGDRTFLLQNLSAYEALGVRYIVTRADDDLAPKPFPLADLQLRNTPHVLLPIAGGFTIPGDGYHSYASLPNSGDFTGSLSVNLSAPISSASVMVGTYLGSSRGMVSLTLCAAGQCETGSADVGHATDNGPLTFRFPSPLNVPPGSQLSYRFHHPDGMPVAIWLSPSFAQTEAPSFSFTGANGETLSGFISSGLTLAFRNNSTSIYQLANALPYASSTGTDCKLNIISRQEMRSSCTAQASLIRRELYFPGWTATVNGAPAEVLRSGLFQSIALPKGEADIRFSYAPPHIVLAYMLALGALAVWLAMLLWAAPAKTRGGNRA
jgi:hypothetical protein